MTDWHRHDNGVVHRDDAGCTWLGNPVPCDPPTLRAVAESIAYEHAAAIDAEFGCCHDEDALRAGGRVPEWEGDEFEPIPDHCRGKEVLDRHLAALRIAEAFDRG